MHANDLGGVWGSSQREIKFLDCQNKTDDFINNLFTDKTSLILKKVLITDKL